MGLETYQKKRDFRRTPEPKGKIDRSDKRRFVVQEHHASKLHFDFRLEMGGVLKSWSVPKGPSLDPDVKRFAVATEDHPVEYLTFQGDIPEGNYGAGQHRIWDSGTYEVLSDARPIAEFEAGKIRFRLQGEKLRGEFTFLRLPDRGDQWLLIKSKDQYAEPGWQLELLLPDEDGNTIHQETKSGTRQATTKHTEVRKTRVRLTSDDKVIPIGKILKEPHPEGDVIAKVGRELVAFSHLDKVYWQQEGYTKGDLIRYYYEISRYILPYLKDRPLIMKRYPNGITGQFFHQHDVDEAPEYARTVALDAVEGHPVDYLICDNLPTLLYMTNLGAIERHPWHSRLRSLDNPDWFVFDLDPGEGVRFTTICKVALQVREILESLGLESYAKTSGSRGIHIYTPIKAIYSYEQIADFAEKIATLAAQKMPKVATVERSLGKREKGQIYVDYMQNARGKSVVAPYSVRPKPKAPVSTPLDWTEVEEAKFRIEDFNITNLLKRVQERGDLFKAVLNNRQKLESAFEEIDGLLQQPKTKRKSA